MRVLITSDIESTNPIEQIINEVFEEMPSERSVMDAQRASLLVREKMFKKEMDLVHNIDLASITPQLVSNHLRRMGITHYLGGVHILNPQQRLLDSDIIVVTNVEGA